MTVFFRAMIASLAVASAIIPAAPVAGDANESQHTKHSTALITARVNERSEAVGAGVMIAVTPNVIVMTARHLAARKNLTLRTWSGEMLRILAEYEVADRDVALIVASGPCTGCEAAETSDSISYGEAIHVWGNPQGKRYVVSLGRVVDLQPTIPGFATNGRFALACDTCDVGDSGGGVFDERGRLLGIITEGWDGGASGVKRVIAEPANHALARVPLEYIAQSDSPAAPKRTRRSLTIMMLCPGADKLPRPVVQLKMSPAQAAAMDVKAIAGIARAESARQLQACLGPTGWAGPELEREAR